MDDAKRPPFCAKSAAEPLGGRSPDFRLGLRELLGQLTKLRSPEPSRVTPVASLGFAPRSQWRDRAGLSPASLLGFERTAGPFEPPPGAIFDWAGF